jgi:membrane-bound serine protease (ClpP class)
LLAQINGRSVMAAGATVKIDTSNLNLIDVDPNWRTKLLAAITDPNIALILMMIGVYGLLSEFLNPGALYPGTIGAICLLTGLYALTALPVNYASVALILLGLALMTAEAFTPSFGILGIGGTVAFILGAAIMIDTDIPQFQISWPVLGAVAIASLGLTMIIMRLALKAYRRKVVSGREELIGSTGRVIEWKDGKGHVFIHSERWQATGTGKLSVGATVRVTALNGLVLGIEPGTHAALDESVASHLKET